MRAWLAVLALPASTAFAQSTDPSDAVDQALSAMADLVAVSSQSENPAVANAALRANQILSNTVESLQGASYYRPPPVMDSTTFQIFYDDLRRRTTSEQQSGISRAGRRHLFSVDQVVSLMKLFVMGDERIRVALTLYRRIV